MGLELAEQLGWDTPDVLLYPTGGGTGLVGIWKAFGELAEMGWIARRQPRFVSVQAEGCAPVVKAWREGAETTAMWEHPVTDAPGLRVPGPFAGRQMLAIVRESGGQGIAVSEREIVDAQRLLARHEGIWTCPEAAAAVAALVHLRGSAGVERDTRIVMVMTGAGIKNPPPEGPPPVHLHGTEDDVLGQVMTAMGAPTAR